MNIMNRFTLRTLRKNKIRTLVTIIGIILSTAMFTGVTSLVFSFQQYLINLEVEGMGAWEGKADELSKEQATELCNDKQLKSTTVVKNIGCARLDNCLNENKPYLYITSIQKNYTQLCPISIVEGRLPRNSEEIVLPQHLEDNGGITYKVGDTLQLEVGQRVLGEGETGGKNTEYIGKEESLEYLKERTYKVVGICTRPPLEKYSMPGYTAYTAGVRDEENVSYDVLFQMKNSLKIKELAKKYQKKWCAETEEPVISEHSDLLRFQGKSTNQSYVAVLRGMGTILILIIMVASVLLIYNAFSISITERTKQFGLLKSIGATKKQIRKSVLFESLSLCLVGIPIGVGGGLLGIGITLHFVDRMLRPMMGSSVFHIEETKLRLVVSWGAIAIAVLVAVFTVLLSAMLPARRAVKMPAIQALRQSNDIRLNRKKLGNGKLVYKLFGFEGMLANKNLKRNRRKHRMTVLSLAVSVILFLATSSFSNYMVQSVNLFDENCITDIALSATTKQLQGNSIEALKKALEQQRGVDVVGYSTTSSTMLQMDAKEVDDEYLDWVKKNFKECYDAKNGKVVLQIYITYVDDVIYESYLKEHHLDVSRFMDSKNVSPLVWDELKIFDDEGHILNLSVFSKENFQGKLYFFNTKKLGEYTFCNEIKNPSDMTLYYDRDNDDSEPKTIPAKDALSEVTFAGSQKMNGKMPLGASDSSWGGIVNFMLPYSALQTLPEQTKMTDTTNFGILAKNHTLANDEITKFIQNGNGYNTSISSTIEDNRAMEDSTRAVVKITNIFSYGFITLITLIVVANVFNTISTNILLRRKEFAMLKSTGMTGKGLNRMMNYECILFGLKGLGFGLPISLVLCYLMYKSLKNAWNVQFLIPWFSVGIVIVSVFIIVFASMLYSMQKIKKDNPIEALRDENM